MNRLEQIQKRMAEVKKEVEKRGIIEAAEQREKLLSQIASSERLTTPVSKRSFLSATHSVGADGEEDSSDPYTSIAYRKAFQSFVTTGREIPAELRADAVTTTTDAGVMIPTTVMNRIIEALSDAGHILPLVIRTAYRGGVQIPTSAVKPTAVWVAEGAGSDKQKKTIGYIQFGQYKLRCAVAMTLEVDTMSLPIFERTIVDNIVEAMVIALETAIINGTGSGQPTGILDAAAPTGQTVTITDNEITFADLTAAEAALPAEYDSKAEWCMSKSTWIDCETITDDSGQPIFRNTIDKNGKFERTLFGRKVNVSGYVPSVTSGIASGTTVAFLFDFKDYILNMNKQITMKKYEDNDTDDQIMKAVALADGKCVRVNSLVKIVTD